MDFNYLDKAEAIILLGLKGILPEDDFTQITAKRQEGERITQTTFRTHQGEKISRIAIERYLINSRASGLVLNIYPDPAYDIPIFTFQLGGQIPDKVIFVLDIIPVGETRHTVQLEEVFKHHQAGMQWQGSNQDWIKELCTDHALICQYKPLDPEVVFKALEAYLTSWVEECYTPATKVTDENLLQQIRENILHFKKVLHANDAGLEIYTKKFGKAIASAIEETAFGAEPPLSLGAQTPAPEDSTEASNEVSPNSAITWSSDAEAYLAEAPLFVRKKIRSNAEEKAKSLGIAMIDRQFVENLRK